MTGSLLVCSTTEMINGYWLGCCYSLPGTKIGNNSAGVTQAAICHS